MTNAEPRNVIEKLIGPLHSMLETPVVWFREKIVESNREPYPWYHQKFRRVPTIDQCDTDDVICYFEADCQYKRDRLVDSEIVNILRQRFEECHMYENPDHFEKCEQIRKQYEEAETNWFIKYGDLGAYHNVKTAFMKQKHRMVFERRYGKVGSGSKTRVDEGKCYCPPEATEEQ